MCYVHHYARRVTEGRIIYRCVNCTQEVDFMAAREEYERLRQGQAEALAPEVVQYDPTAGMIETPAGLARFVAYDGAGEVVTVEVDYRYLAEFPAGECYLAALIGGRGAA